MFTMHRDYLDRTAVGRKILNIEIKLILFALYLGFLVFLWIWQRNWWFVFYSHLVFVFVFSIFYFGRQFLYIFIAPLMAAAIPVMQFFINRYLKQFKQNVPTEVAIILGHGDWTKLEAWVKPNASLGEIKLLVKYLQLKKQDFSFYPRASLEDVERIMADNTIREVYFFGHGSSHVFQLKTDDILYYCEFNNPRYGKDFVHQVHCGTPDGKSLVDYVVSDSNKSKCFLIRKPITGYRIEKEFKQKIKEAAA